MTLTLTLNPNPNPNPNPNQAYLASLLVLVVTLFPLTYPWIVTIPWVLAHMLTGYWGRGSCLFAGTLQVRVRVRVELGLGLGLGFRASGRVTLTFPRCARGERPRHCHPVRPSQRRGC